MKHNNKEPNKKKSNQRKKKQKKKIILEEPEDINIDFKIDGRDNNKDEIVSYKQMNMLNIFSIEDNYNSEATEDITNKMEKYTNTLQNVIEEDNSKIEEDFDKYCDEFELEYNSFINIINKNLYLSRYCELDSKKKELFLNDILIKARNKKDNEKFTDIEIIILMFLNIRNNYSDSDELLDLKIKKTKAYIDLYKYPKNIKKELELQMVNPKTNNKFKKSFNFYEIFNCFTQSSGTLKSLITEYEFNFLWNIKNIFINIDENKNIYNLFDLKDFEINKKEIIKKHIKQHYCDYEYFNKEFIQINSEVNPVKINGNFIQLKEFFMINYFAYMYFNTQIKNLKLKNLIIYFKNKYNHDDKEIKFITHEIDLNKEKNKKLNYIIVKEYSFLIFNHYYTIDSDDIIYRFKYNLLVLEDINVRFNELLEIENLFEESNLNKIENDKYKVEINGEHLYIKENEFKKHNNILIIRYKNKELIERLFIEKNFILIKIKCKKNNENNNNDTNIIQPKEEEIKPIKKVYYKYNIGDYNKINIKSIRKNNLVFNDVFNNNNREIFESEINNRIIKIKTNSCIKDNCIFNKYKIIRDRMLLRTDSFDINGCLDTKVKNHILHRKNKNFIKVIYENSYKDIIGSYNKRKQKWINNLEIDKFGITIFPKNKNILLFLSKNVDEYTYTMRDLNCKDLINELFIRKLNMMFIGVNNNSYKDNPEVLKGKRSYKNLEGIDNYTNILLYKKDFRCTNINKYDKEEESKKINELIDNKDYKVIFNFQNDNNIINTILDNYDVLYAEFKLNKVDCYYQMILDEYNIYFLSFIIKNIIAYDYKYYVFLYLFNFLNTHENNYSIYTYNLFETFKKNERNKKTLNDILNNKTKKSKIDYVFNYDMRMTKRNLRLINILCFLGIKFGSEFNYNYQIPISPFHLFLQNAIIVFYESFTNYKKEYNKIALNIFLDKDNSSIRKVYTDIFKSNQLYYKFFTNYVTKGNIYMLYDYLDYLEYKVEYKKEILTLEELFSFKQYDANYISNNNIEDIYNVKNEYENKKDYANLHVLIKDLNEIKEYKNSKKYNCMYNAYFMFYPEEVKSFYIFMVKNYTKELQFKDYGDVVKKCKEMNLKDQTRYYGEYNKEILMEKYLKIKYKEKLKKYYNNNLKTFNINKLNSYLAIKKNNRLLVFNKPKGILFGITQYIKDILKKIEYKRKSNEFKLSLLRSIIRNFKDNYQNKYIQNQFDDYSQYLYKLKHWELYNYYIK